MSALRLVCLSALLLGLATCLPAAETNSVVETNAPAAMPEPEPVSAREFFNAGTRRLSDGKLNEAETLLQTALARQDEAVRPPTLYNLGHVRFAQGVVELKKSLEAGPTAKRGTRAIQQAEDAIGIAEDAMASKDMQKMVAAYQRGRGARKELREAAKAVRRALELHGAALRRWERALGDFKSAAELNPGDTNSTHNAEVVERAIAKLVDSIHELQQVAMCLGQPQRELGEKLKQLKGMIPEPLMPPGAPGDDEEEENGKSQEPEPGQVEPESRDGTEFSLSPEEAGWLLEGFKLDEQRRLPMGQEDTAQPKDRNRRNW